MGQDRMESVCSWVLDEGKGVTLKWVAYKLDIPSHEAKRLLDDFVGNKAKELEDRGIVVTYLLAGKRHESPSHHIRLVKKDDLDKERQTMELVTAQHVYAIHAGKKQLWNIDHENVMEIISREDQGKQAFLKNSWGCVRLPNVEIRTAGRRVVPPKPSGSSGLSSSASKGLNPPESKLKKKTTTKDFFGTSAPTKPTAKSNPPNEESKPSDPAVPAHDGPSSTENDKKSSKKRKAKDPEDVLDLSDAPSPKRPEKKQKPSEGDTNEDETKQVLQAKKPIKRAHVIVDSDEEAEFDPDPVAEKEDDHEKKNAKRKRTELSREELEKREAEKLERKLKLKEEKKATKQALKEEQAREAKARFTEQLGASSQSSALSSGEKRTKTIRKLVTKQFVDEDGFMVSKEEYEEVPVTDDDDPDNDKDGSSQTRRKSSPGSKTTSNESPNLNAKKKGKQTKMLSFFSKKPKS